MPRLPLLALPLALLLLAACSSSEDAAPQSPSPTNERARATLDAKRTTPAPVITTLSPTEAPTAVPTAPPTLPPTAPPTAPPTLPPTAPPTAPPAPAANCDPSYPTVCIPPPPPDLDCGDITFRRFTVLPPDPHGLDGNDNDGIGCES